jgi:succinate dehydrogenase / fumarate reductase membrane anchor subunit
MSNQFFRGYFDFPSKHKGASHWLLQRITGVILMFLSLWFLFNLFSTISGDYMTARHWIACPLNASLFGLFIIFILYHGYLGLEVIIDDYIHMAFWHSAAFFCLKGLMAVTFSILAISFYNIIF